MKRSRGSRSKTRKKLKKGVREKGMTPVNRIIQGFKEGDRVGIAINPSYQKGQPHPRYHGKTGIILGKRGRAYLIEIRDKNARKTLISTPVHLKAQEGVNDRKKDN